jgi:glycosyltransferase involved in cell wall biosynthesis
MVGSITFVIFTYNEEKRIERVIKNFKNYGNVLIADNRSTDRTQEIARENGCEILIREKHYVYVENQEMVNLIYDKITTNWIYWGFADEMLEKDTLIQIRDIIAQDKHDIISMDRKNYFYGSFCDNIYNAYTHKIFRRGAIDFTQNVIHGMGTPTVSAERIYTMPDIYFIHHFISNTASSYLNVINRYTDEEVKFSQKNKTSIWYLVYLVFKVMVSRFLKRGYKAKYAGVALTELTVFYELIKNMKLYEDANGLDTPAIEKKNDKYRDEILRGV